MQVMAASREIYASGVTIEHFMTGCMLSSFQGKSPQVQSMMVNDINSDKVGPGMQLEELVSNYSEHAPIRFWAWGGATPMFLKLGTSGVAMFLILAFFSSSFKRPQHPNDL